MLAMIAPLVLTTVLQAPRVADAPSDPAAATPAVADEGGRSLGAVVEDLPHAFGRLRRWKNLAVVGASAAAAAAVRRDDRDLAADAAGSRTLDRMTEGGSIVGSGYVQVAAAAAAWLSGTVSGHPGIEALGADLLEAQAVNGVLTTALKYSVHRTRPNGGRYSFPSGHTSATFATAEVLEERYGLKAGIPAYALGAYVAASRLHDRQHFASDALVGAGVGLLSGRVTRASRGRRVTAAIVPVGRGAAVVGTVACPW